jgi:hypothetical protein
MKYCDNSVKSGNNYIGIPKCYNNPQEYEVKIKYINCLGDEHEEDIMYICGKCLELLKKAVKKDGYKIFYRKLK